MSLLPRAYDTQNSIFSPNTAAAAKKLTGIAYAAFRKVSSVIVFMFSGLVCAVSQKTNRASGRINEASADTLIGWAQSRTVTRPVTQDQLHLLSLQIALKTQSGPHRMRSCRDKTQ